MDGPLQAQYGRGWGGQAGRLPVMPAAEHLTYVVNPPETPVPIEYSAGSIFWGLYGGLRCVLHDGAIVDLPSEAKIEAEFGSSAIKFDVSVYRPEQPNYNPLKGARSWKFLCERP